MRGALLTCWLLMLVNACDKAPPEPPALGPLGASPTTKEKGNPETDGDVPGVASAHTQAARCVRPLPAEPPAAPRYRVDPRCPADPAGGPPMVPVGHVVFSEAKDAPTLEVELMLTEPNQERGLMYRRSMAEDHGMLFAWGAPSEHTFWMHNTCIPLDMLFIDADGLISGIVENAPTLNDEGRSVDCPVTYVLEVNAGWSRRHGVAPGEKVQIEGLAAASP